MVGLEWQLLEAEGRDMIRWNRRCRAQRAESQLCTYVMQTFLQGGDSEIEEKDSEPYRARHRVSERVTRRVKTMVQLGIKQTFREDDRQYGWNGRQSRKMPPSTSMGPEGCGLWNNSRGSPQGGPVSGRSGVAESAWMRLGLPGTLLDGEGSGGRWGVTLVEALPGVWE